MTWTLPPVDRRMFAGVVGEVVKLFSPYTEAHPVAIAVQFLVAAGNAIGRGPHVYVGQTVHHVNEFVALVGASSRARKGDSKNIALHLFRLAAPAWRENV